MGERMVVRSRSTWAMPTWARAWATWASVDCISTWVRSNLAFRSSSSASPITFLSASARARSCSRLAAAWFTAARAEEAWAFFREARACSRLALKRVGSIWAMICPSFTWLLKSAPSFWMIPETCEPTSTVTTALSCPVAVTVCSMVPRSTLATLKVTSVLLADRRRAK